MSRRTGQHEQRQEDVKAEQAWPMRARTAGGLSPQGQKDAQGPELEMRWRAH